MTIENKHKFLPFDLQFFAEGGEGEGAGTGDSGEGGQESEKVELTAEELQKKIESESDKKLEKALKTAREKWQQEFQEKLEQEKKEAERLAKLSEKERKEEELSKREQEVADREAKLKQKELKADAVSVLADKTLPASFADFLLADDAEKTLENINNFKAAFDSAVNEAVKEKLRQDTPKAGGGSITTKNPFSKEHFNLTEQGRLLKDDPELYKQLKAQAGK